MKREAHGAQETRHNMGLGEFLSAAQQNDSSEQPFNQCFLVVDAVFNRLKDLEMIRHILLLQRKRERRVQAGHPGDG